MMAAHWASETRVRARMRARSVTKDSREGHQDEAHALTSAGFARWLWVLT